MKEKTEYVFKLKIILNLFIIIITNLLIFYFQKQLAVICTLHKHPLATLHSR